jgi:hypothetical protein
MVLVTMKKIQLILGCIALSSVAGCGGTDNSTSTGPATSAVTSTVAGHGGDTTTGGPVAPVTATVETDGVLFVGADTTRVGATISVTVKNETTGPITVTLQDPAGTTADTAQVSGGGTDQISAAATTPGKWTVRLDGATIPGGESKVIIVT